jgi:hypothetical protein
MMQTRPASIAAERLAAVIVGHERPVLGFATGSGPGTARSHAVFGRGWSKSDR